MTDNCKNHGEVGKLRVVDTDPVQLCRWDAEKEVLRIYKDTKILLLGETIRFGELEEKLGKLTEYCGGKKAPG